MLFIDLRDRYGITQVSVNEESNPEAFAVLQGVKGEYVVSVTGTVTARPDNMVNADMATGAIELVVSRAEILNQSEVLPFQVSEKGDEQNISEDLRLKHRYIDMRKPRIAQRMAFRAEFLQFTRNWFTNQNFMEVQTPLLTGSSPEGARDFLVPSRFYPGKFYALPQAPQQYKQLLMVGGIDRYFQIAPCMRDEDLRADRSLEFYQLDVETSFLTQEEFFQLVEPYFIEVTESLTDKKIMSKPFPRLTYKEVMDKYGSDKPDIRYGFEFHDVSDWAKNTGFSVFNSAPKVKGICVTGGASFSRKDIDGVLTPIATNNGAKGLAWMKLTDEGWTGGVSKFFTPEELDALQAEFGAAVGDIILFIADEIHVINKALDQVRRQSAEMIGAIDNNVLAYAWVIDYPMYEADEETGKIDFSHNPFSMPQGGLEALNNDSPLDILAYQYDIICNGYELSSGAVRNHVPEIMYKAFEIAGYEKAQVDAEFGHMIEAFAYGAPPHCGFAPGIERMLMILQGEDNIRDVIPFPKNNKGVDPLMNAPAGVFPEQLEELSLKIEIKKEEE
jgi:aspartyl-tRNA synthetase